VRRPEWVVEPALAVALTLLAEVRRVQLAQGLPPKIASLIELKMLIGLP
jgi:hypothetical protein